tara:strand:- start:1653 stop:2339 length:687 start_codon:yes stop_codon:yes gene_type:complete
MNSNSNSPYSQLNQDLWVLEFFQNKRNGVFLDIGAFDGVNLSNTYLLEKNYGWTGLCVEANSATFEKLKKSRNCVCVNEMLSNKAGKVVSLQRMGELSFGDSKNVFNIDVDEMRNAHADLDTSIEHHVTNTLVNVLETNGIPKIIDYLSIDVEGMELEILENFDFAKYHVNLITIEHNAAHIGMKYRNELHDLLSAKGFRFVKGNDNVQGWRDDLFYIEDFYANEIIK